MANWISKALTPWRRKSISVAKLWDIAEGRDNITSSFQSMVKQGFKKNGIVFGAVSMVARSVGAVPWVLFREDSQGERQEVIKHDLLDLLRRPNPKKGGSRFFEQMVTFLLIGGTDYLLRVQAERGEPLRLYNLRPDLVEPKDEKNPESDWIYKPHPNDPSKNQEYKYEDILPLYLLDPLDENDGLSPIEVSALTVEQGNFSRKWNRNLLTHSARPPGIIKAKTDMALTPEQMDKIEERIAEKYSGIENPGATAVLKGDVEWIKTGFSPAEMEWLEGQKVSDRLTAFTFGVASQLLGDTESSTYSNYQEARKALYQERVIPLLSWIRDELNNWLAPAFGEGFVLDYNKDSIDALQSDRNEHWERVANADFLSLNEKREATNYEPVGPGGDVIVTSRGIVITPAGEVFGPATLIPLSSDGGKPAGNNGDDDDEAQISVLLDGMKAQSKPVQTLVLAKSRFSSRAAAVTWVTSHDFHAAKVDETENSWRFRQFDPAMCVRGSHRTIRLTEGVQAVTCAQRPKTAPEALEIAAFNLESPEALQAHGKAFDRERTRFEDMARLLVGKRFRTERGAIIAAARKRGTPDGIGGAIDTVLAEQADEWRKLYRRIYLTVGTHFGRRTLESFPKGLPTPASVLVARCGGEWKQDEDDLDDLFAAETDRYLAGPAGEKIVGIGKVTKAKITRQLAEGVAEGEGVDKLAARIDKFLEKIIPHRAEVVARTEVIAASNFGSFTAAKSTGVAARKFWLPIIDDRTRRIRKPRDKFDHIEVNGQVRGLDEPFNVSGEQLMFPGDSSLGASAGNVIQCRCTQTYSTERA